MNKFLCWLIGHIPRGPVSNKLSDPVRYRCERCDRLLHFNIETGWGIVDE